MALPIEPALGAIEAALRAKPNLVLQAPPGAGKTTRVPLALLDAPWLAGRKIIVIEPRRIAARGAARRMADTLGESVGETIGWRMRLDTKVGAKTRIEVVTDGLFTRRLHQDPELSDIGIVLFDEFHERRLESDLALSLCLEAQQAYRPELRLVAMSATLDGAELAKHMAASIVTSEGHAFPVETRHVRPRASRIEDDVASVVRRAIAEDRGDILVFLPGLPEIRRTAQLLDDLPKTIDCHLLHGDIGIEAQDLSIRPAPAGRRKVVLASAIAETSLTIEGIGVVIDSGLMRVARHDPETGIGRLETIRVSLASADQRRGRAGRVGPGVCYRLWAEAETRGLRARNAPEIETADMTGLALDLAVWGGGLEFLPSPPPRAAFAAAQAVLKQLGALDQDARLTGHGRSMAEIGLPPRLAHMVVKARKAGLGALAADLAAVLSERDPLRGAGSDLASRLEALRNGDRRFERIARLARTWRQNAPPWQSGDLDETGRLVAWAYPERVAALRAGQRSTYRLANGRGAELDPLDSLAGSPYLAIADLDDRIHLAARLSEAAIECDFAEEIVEEAIIRFEPREAAVVARQRRRFRDLVLADRLISDPPRASVAQALIAAIRAAGPDALDWSPEARQLRARVDFLRRNWAEIDWPDWSDETLMERLEDWLAPALDNVMRLADVKRIDPAPLLSAMLDHHQRRELDRLAPKAIAVPSGSTVNLDYDSGDRPILAVKLQEMFGLSDAPKVAGGRVAVLLHLLSPAGRPVQVTSDLGGFWRSSYAAVRADLRGRYPKHAWPEDPASAIAHRGTKKGSNRESR